jgi:putative Ca2+/H+ antiporter (TMEM165/GDT1 family)
LDWKPTVATFFLVFLAELGDKTQLLIMSMSARSKAPQMVFYGAALALVASSLVAVLAGEPILRVVPTRAIRVGTGVAFLGIGAMLLYRGLR